jgi:hypothetical protein
MLGTQVSSVGNGQRAARLVTSCSTGTQLVTQIIKPSAGSKNPMMVTGLAGTRLREYADSTRVSNSRTLRNSSVPLLVLGYRIHLSQQSLQDRSSHRDPRSDRDPSGQSPTETMMLGPLVSTAGNGQRAAGRLVTSCSAGTQLVT